MERMVGQIRQLPKELWPAIQSHWSDQKCFSGMAGYLRALPNCAKDAAQLHPPAHIPQIILSAATATQGELRERDKWVQDSSLSRHIRLHDAGHWIQLDQPEALLETVRNVIENVRSQAVI
jgi:pimeloyl-ACP methyl ester carboxylesterase